MSMDTYQVAHDIQQRLKRLDDALPKQVGMQCGEQLVTSLERWANYGDGRNARADLKEWLYLLLCGDAAEAVIWAPRYTLPYFGAVLLLMRVDLPHGCCGSSEDVRAWRGLANQI
jgi:hypothetical protein